MIAATPSEQRTAKARFFIAYLLSVVIVVAIAAYFWKKDVPVATVAPVKSAPVTDNGAVISRTNLLLLQQYQQLQTAYADVTTKSSDGAAVANKASAAEGMFIKTLDSLEEVTGDENNEEVKADVSQSIKGYRTLLAGNTQVVKKFAQLLTDKSQQQKPVMVQQPVAPLANNQVAELQKVIASKEAAIATMDKQRQAEVSGRDRTIASLQTQLAQRPVQVVQKENTGGGEWKQKHDKIKASYDNILSRNNALANTNKSLVDDNRRLLSQLQASRRQ